MSRRYDDVLLLLALCPLLAVSDTVVKALGLGLTALCILPLASALMQIVRRRLAQDAALAAAVLLLSGAIGCAELAMRAWLHELHQALGVFLSLLFANLVILEQLRADERPLLALRSAVELGACVLLVLLALAVPRELVGRGSLLHDAGRLLEGQLPELATGLTITVFRVDMGFLLAMLPPGAFISLGLLLALRNRLLARGGNVRAHGAASRAADALPGTPSAAAHGPDARSRPSATP